MPGLRLGIAVGRQIDFVSSDEEASLAGLGALQCVTQFDRRYPDITDLIGLVHVAPGVFAEPDRHADDGKQRQKPNQKQDDSRVDDKAAGYRHTRLKFLRAPFGITVAEKN